jgi:hypothetical protein
MKKTKGQHFVIVVYMVWIGIYLECLPYLEASSAWVAFHIDIDTIDLIMTSEW